MKQIHFYGDAEAKKSSFISALTNYLATDRSAHPMLRKMAELFKLIANGTIQVETAFIMDLQLLGISLMKNKARPKIVEFNKAAASIQQLESGINRRDELRSQTICLNVRSTATQRNKAAELFIYFCDEMLKLHGYRKQKATGNKRKRAVKSRKLTQENILFGMASLLKGQEHKKKYLSLNREALADLCKMSPRTVARRLELYDEMSPGELREKFNVIMGAVGSPTHTEMTVDHPYDDSDADSEFLDQ